jgi:hypothetical protein
MTNILKRFLNQKPYLFIVVVICLATFLFRLAIVNQNGGIPPGSDPGNWLAFSKQLFGNETKAALATYPPVLPFLTWIFCLFLPDIVSVSILGIVISAIIGFVIFIVARESVAESWAALFSVPALFLGYSMEMWAWGGYPQLLAQTLVVLSIFFVCKWLLNQHRKYFWFAVLSAGLAIGTSSIAIPLIAAGIPVACLVILKQSHLKFKQTIGKFFLLVLCIIGLSALFGPWYIATAKNSIGAIWNPIGYSLTSIDQAFAYAFKDWGSIFSSIAVVLPLSLLVTAYSIIRIQPKPLLGAVTAAINVASIILFCLSFEVRVLAVFQIGILFGITLLLYDLYRIIAPHPRLVSVKILTVVIAIIISISIIICGNRRFLTDLEWYCVVDRPVLEALDYLRSQPDKAIVIAAENPNKNFYFWWIEGYSGHPVFSASDIRWLNFTEEREQHAIASTILTGKPDIINSLASQYKIKYIFLDKEVPADIVNVLDAGFVSVFENERIIILWEGLSLLDPPPDWWPGETSTETKLYDVIPPRPDEQISPPEADYYRVWYQEARNHYRQVLGSTEDWDLSYSLQKIVDKSPLFLWSEIFDLKSANAAGVVGNPECPGYDFSLWQSFGKPTKWQISSINTDLWLRVTLPEPPPGVTTDVVKEWYKWNRAALASVYYGVADSDRETHVIWADRYDDLSLYTEIIKMRLAYNSGVRGSMEEPYKAFEDWERNTYK